MVDLEKVVNEVRDDLKALYLKDQNAVWTKPFVVMIGADDTSVMENANDQDAVIEWLRHFRGPNQIKGIVVGRMVAKFSSTIRDQDGNPQILERAILVSGRMLDAGQTYVSITSAKEHNDLRSTPGDEPNENKPFVPGLTSPDKVDKIIGSFGQLKGFKSMQFQKEVIFDSRKGEMCQLDPIIDGVLAMPVGPAGPLGPQ